MDANQSEITSKALSCVTSKIHQWKFSRLETSTNVLSESSGTWGGKKEKNPKETKKQACLDCKERDVGLKNPRIIFASINHCLWMINFLVPLVLSLIVSM